MGASHALQILEQDVSVISFKPYFLIDWKFVSLRAEYMSVIVCFDSVFVVNVAVRQRADLAQQA
jgi:hypothetical protein